MADTKIEWCDKVWNPVVGCTKCSPGCLNCYAEKFAARLAAMGHNKYIEVMDRIDWLHWNGKIFCDISALDQPLHWRKPSRIFVCSMGDLFHEKVPFEFIAKVWDIMFECHQHVFLILTKRIKRAEEFCEWLTKAKFRVMEHFNIHFGVSISTYLEMWKADVLEEIPAAIRYISFEPLLEDVPIKIGNIDWVVVGGESGPGRRPCKIEWIESIVDQCKDANVPVFVKQIHRDGKVVKMPKEFPQELPERS